MGAGPDERGKTYSQSRQGLQLGVVRLRDRLGGQLNAYGWWKVSQITYIVSLALFGLGSVPFLAGVFGFARIRREQPGAVVFGPAIEQINQAGHETGASA